MRLHGSHDEGCLLAFHDADLRLWPLVEQMLAEEALVEAEILGDAFLETFFLVHPVLVSFVPPAVRLVLHDVAGAHPLLAVDLPEDDVAPLRGSDAIVLVDGLHDGGIEPQLLHQSGREPLPEGAVGRVRLADQFHRQLPERRWWRQWLCWMEVDHLLPHPGMVVEILLRPVVVAA